MESSEFGPVQPPLGPSEAFGSDVPDFARSPNGEIVAWGTYDLEQAEIVFTEGPITNDVLEYESVDHYVVHWFDDDGGEHWHTVEGFPDDLEPLDDVIERLYEQYG